MQDYTKLPVNGMEISQDHRPSGIPHHILRWYFIETGLKILFYVLSHMKVS